MPDSTAANIATSPVAAQAAASAAASRGHTQHSDTAARVRAEHSAAELTPRVRTDSTATDSTAIDSIAAAAPPRPVEVKAAPSPPPPPPAWLKGIEPVPRPQSPAGDPVVAGIFIALFLIVSLCLRHAQRLFKMLWRDLTSIRSREKGFDERTPADLRMVAILYIQLIIFLAMLTQSALRLGGHIPPGVAPISLTGTLALMWALYYVVARSACFVLGYTFAPGEEAALQLVRGFNASQVLAGFVLAVPAVCAVFWPPNTLQAVIAAGAIYLLARIAFIVKCFKIFYSGTGSLLYFFLYLCTLEIVPMVIIYRCALSISNYFSA